MYFSTLTYLTLSVFLKMTGLGPKEMAQTRVYLPQEHKDLSSGPQHPHKKPDMTLCTSNLLAGNMETGRDLVLADQLDEPNQRLAVSGRDPVSKIKEEE